jgi:adenosylcobinamide amidohydrolase
MKYLKLYEALEKGYKKLSSMSTGPGDDEWNRFLSDKVRNLSYREADRITKCIKFIDHSKIELKETYISVYLQNIKSHISITKYDDEWFLVIDYPYYYACDGVDGVIEYLKSIT